MQGSQVTECVIFLSLMVLWASYTLLYFQGWLSSFVPRGQHDTVVVNLWGAAMRSRRAWALDIMARAGDAKGEGLLAVQQMRNMIVSATLFVMGIAQVMGRLIMIMTTEANLQTIASLARKDPMTGPADSWAPPEVRVAVPLGGTLLALLSFGQSVRLALHVGFLTRVFATTGGKGVGPHHGDDILLQEEIVAMLQRAELYFTCGLRFMYFFIGTIFWVLGTTPLLVSSLTTLVLLLCSDILFVRRHKAGHNSHNAAAPAGADAV